MPLYTHIKNNTNDPKNTHRIQITWHDNTVTYSVAWPEAECAKRLPRILDAWGEKITNTKIVARNKGTNPQDNRPHFSQIPPTTMTEGMGS